MPYALLRDAPLGSQIANPTLLRLLGGSLSLTCLPTDLKSWAP